MIDVKAQIKKAETDAKREGHKKLLFMHLDRESLPRPEPEYRFHPPRKWSLDFAWWFCSLETFEEVKIALEVEGGIYTKAKGHRSVTNFEADLIKYNQLAIDGWRLIRVLPEHLQMKRMEAINWLEDILRPYWSKSK